MMVVFVPNFTGAAIPTGWAVLWGIVPLFLAVRRIHFSSLNLFGLLILGFAGLTFFWTTAPYDGVYAFAQIAAFALCVVLGSTLRDLKPLYVGMAFGLLVNDAIAIAQWLEWSAIGEMSRPAGLFVSKDVLGEISALLLIAFVGRRMWVFCPLTLPGIVLTGSRGALLALGVAVLVWTKSRLLMAFVVGLLLAAVAATFWTGYRVDTLLERWAMWREVFPQLDLFGHGLGSFGRLTFGQNAIRPDHLHNDYLEFGFELGLVPLALAGLFFVRCLRAPRLPEHAVLSAFLVLATVEMPFHVPPECFLGGLVAGFIGGHGSVVCDLRSRGRSDQFTGLQNRRSQTYPAGGGSLSL